jgi:hypothetical protein
LEQKQKEGMIMSISLRALSAALCTAGAFAATVVAAPSAAAADRVADPCGFYPNGGLCYRYASYQTGASAGFTFNVPDLLSPTRWVFRPDGAGAGTRVANNAGSAENRSPYCVNIYYWENYNEGHGLDPSVHLLPGQRSNTLGSVNNNNRSHRFQFC